MLPRACRAFLQVEQQGSAEEGAPAGTRSLTGRGDVGDHRNVRESSVGAFRRSWPEAGTHARRRSVVQKSGGAVEDAAPGEEAAEDLRVTGVNPFAAELKGVVGLDECEPDANVGAP